MKTITKIFAWIKNHILWILGGIIVILSAIFGIKYERDKIAKLKADVEVSKVKAEIAELASRRDAVLDRDKENAKKDGLLGEEIEKKFKEIEQVRAEAKKKDAKEIARRINEIYKNQGLI